MMISVTVRYNVESVATQDNEQIVRWYMFCHFDVNFLHDIITQGKNFIIINSTF